MRTNSVLSYILLTLEQLGYQIKEVETVKGEKRVKNPADIKNDSYFGVRFEKTLVDKLMLDGKLSYSLKDGGINVKTDKGTIPIKFDHQRFRPAEVPILMSDTKRIQQIGFSIKRTIRDIIRDQINYYLNPENRRL
jgi:GDPmannose 4,6-dehydratase